MNAYVVYVDIDLLISIGFVWILIGLLWLLIVLRFGMRNEDDYEYISEKLGIVVLKSIIGWPYNLFCWIFSRTIWLTPVNQIFKRK